MLLANTVSSTYFGIYRYLCHLLAMNEFTKVNDLFIEN